MRKHFPLFAALISVVLWASAFVGIRAAGRSFSPGALALGRLALGTALLGALALARPLVRPSRRELALLVLAGLLWFGVYNVALNEAEQRVDAGTAAMLVLIAPIFIVALAAAFLKERATPNLLLGGALALTGVVVIGFATSTGSASLVGVILCLVAALSSAIGLVAEKPVLNRISALQATWTCCAVGALFCLPYAPSLVRELQVAPTGGIAWLLFLGVFPTSIAFTTWAYALARGSAGRLAATAYLVPPITIVMSWLILGEVPSVIAVLGGALCLVGVYSARKVPKAIPLIVLGLLPATAQAQDSVVYRLSPASEFQVKTGKAGLFGFAGHEHLIQARAFSGRVVYYPDSIAASHVEITVLAESLEVLTPPDTEEIRKVTAAMRTQTLDVANYPEIRLVSRRVERNGRRLDMTAALTIKDQTRDVPLTIELDIGPPPDTLRAVTQFAVKQTDFGIRPFRGGPAGTVRVADRVTFAITAVAVREAP